MNKSVACSTINPSKLSIFKNLLQKGKGAMIAPSFVAICYETIFKNSLGTADKNRLSLQL
jgi:hypothetical protein